MLNAMINIRDAQDPTTKCNVMLFICLCFKHDTFAESVE